MKHERDECERRTLAVILGYIQKALEYLSHNYAAVLALVTVLYAPVIYLDIKTYRQIGDCESYCKSQEKLQPPPMTFTEQLALSLHNTKFIDPFAEPIADSDPLSTTPYSDESQILIPSINSPISTAAQLDYISSVHSYTYHRQESVMQCLKETNDCDVIVSFKQADLSSIPPLTDAKYWPNSSNETDDESYYDDYKRATMLRAQDLIALLQSHAMNATRSVQYLLRYNFSAVQDYTWIYPTIRVAHMTTELLLKLEYLQELQSLEMNPFKVVYSSSSETDIWFQEVFGEYLLNTTLCSNCYFESGVTKAPCYTPNHPKFKIINCTDALKKGVQFNCDLMSNRGRQYCNDRVLPLFQNCDNPIGPGNGTAEFIRVPKLEKTFAPSYLVDLLGSNASGFLTPARYPKEPVIASFDSGVNFDHIILKKAYRGYSEDGVNHEHNWFSQFGDPAPVDVRNHGTPVLSVALGGYEDSSMGGYKSFGAAARSSKWIAATCDSGDPNLLQNKDCYLQVLQWFLNLTAIGKGADVVLMPFVVNMEDEDMFRPIYGSIEHFRNSSIFVTALGKPKSALESQDWCASMRPPASLDNVFTVGAVSADKKHSMCNAAGGVAYGRRGNVDIKVTDVIKPELVTFGEGIICATGNNSFQYGMTGTSFSAGLMAGVLAHFRAKYPTLDLENYRAAMKDSCIPIKTPQSNLDNLKCPMATNLAIYFGAGLLNATALDAVLHQKFKAKARAEKRRRTI